MASSRDRTGQGITTAVRIFLALPNRAKLVIIGLVLVGILLVVVQSRRGSFSGKGSGANVPAGTFVFMFWNVEDLFDDRPDHRNSIDRPYDEWFARDGDARRLKYDHLAEMILSSVDGRGPDILVCVEVETPRAAELLKDALNAKLPEGITRYEYVAMKEMGVAAGRHIAPCIISKIELDDSRTRLLGSHNLRVLETHVVANGADLCLVASHWTSQLSDDGSRKGSGRDKYATTIYAEYEKVVDQNPDADFLLCGDFNTSPDSDVVTEQLHLIGRRDEVVPTRSDPKLFGLLSGKSPELFGTHYFKKPLIYDQIGISPGLLDEHGWGCDPASVRVPTAGMMRGHNRRPWRFGNEGGNPDGRGYSDHFPVVVNLFLSTSP